MPMLSGYKTYIVAVVACVTALGAYMAGDATLAETIQLCVTAALGATLRAGIASKPGAKPVTAKPRK